jgi:hypothetical protein
VAWSLIPDFILPWHSYGRQLIVDWLLARMRGSAYRSQTFLVQQGIVHAPAEAMTSWSDMLDCQRTQPGYQRFHGWTRRFTRGAQKCLDSLMAVLAWLSLDLRQVVVEVATLQQAASPTSPLTLALAVMLVMPSARAPDPDQRSEHLARLVGILVMRPLPVSHKVRRASGGRIVYDTLVI